MNPFTHSYAIWLADFYLLSTILLAFALAAVALLKQPAQRLAVVKSALVGLVLLATLCALPGWSVLHVWTAEQSKPVVEEPRPVSSSNSVVLAKPAPILIDAAATERPRSTVPPAVVEPLPVETRSVQFHWASILPIAHLTGAACIMSWLLLGLMASLRLRRNTQPAPPNIIAMLNEVIAEQQPDIAQPELRTHARIDVAVALGIWRPIILLPSQWADRESSDHLRAVLTHESTHVFNHDLQWLAVTRLLFIAMWANPLFWFVKRRLRLDQEALADAAAAELTSRQLYAEQLVAWARRVGSQPTVRLSAAVGLWERPSQLRQRVALLLNEHLKVIRDCSRRWRLASLVTCVLLASALSLLTLQPGEGAPPGKSDAQTTAELNPSKDTQNGGRPQPNVDPVRQSDLRREPNTATGRAVDENDHPVSRAEVFLFRVNQNDGTRKLLGQKSTDAEGRFRFDYVIDIDKEFPGRKFPASYESVDELLEGFVRAPGRITNSWLLMPQHVAKAGEYHEAKMLPAATFRGRVTDSGGKPVAGALVSIGNGSIVRWEGARTSRTDADGNYKIDDAEPFEETTFKKELAEEERRSKEEKESGNLTFATFVRRPILTVEHPDFAAMQTTFDKSPGSKDVRLEPAAALEGRVTFADSGMPAAGALVGVVTSFERGSPPPAPPWTDIHRFFVRANAEGKYHVGSLPPGKYELWAETPDWVNGGINDVAAVAGKTSKVPDLKFTKGGVVSARVVDAKTRQPITISPDARVMMLIRPVSPRPSSRPMPAPFITANSEGRFELHLPPGRTMVGAGGVETSGQMKYSGPPTTEVNLVEGETVTADLPVSRLEIPEQRGHSVQRKSGPSLTARAADMRRSGRSREALAMLNAILEKDPKNIEALLSRADALSDMGNDREAIAELEQIIKLDPPYPRTMIAYNNLACILATSPHDSVRDGKRALQLAEKAKQVSRTPNPDVLDTMAAAHAELGDFDKAVASQKEAIELARQQNRRDSFSDSLKLYEARKPRREPVSNSNPPMEKDSSNIAEPEHGTLLVTAPKSLNTLSPARPKIQLVQATKPAAEPSEIKRPPTILGYGDDKPDGKKSYGGSGQMIRFELPEGVTKIKGMRIHSSRYGEPQAPKEDFEITFLSEKRDETLHVEAAPYRLFNRGKEQWVRIPFKNEVELPRRFWVCLNFNAAKTKGVYVSYDTSTKGQYSRVGLAGDKEEPKETDFHGDWMVQLFLSPAKK